MPGNPELDRRLLSIEELLRKVESTADPNLRATVQELVETVMSLHGAGIERMLDLIRAAGEPGEAVIHRLGRDELVGNLLILYGLHPLPLEARIMQALDKARVRLRSHGGEVELISIEGGELRLRIEAKGSGCGSTPLALKEQLEGAIYGAVPDLTGLVIEGAEDKQAFVPLEMLSMSGARLNAALHAAGEDTL
jgi:Fe-S cluster biogenesis protein NfuA